jgi:hypothetical protein
MEGRMAVTVLRKARNTPRYSESEPLDWVAVAACGSLVAGGLLLLAGKKRAGIVAAASGTALAMLEHEDTIRNWWDSIPSYLGQVHSMLDKAQDAVDKIADKGQSLRRVLGR